MAEPFSPQAPFAILPGAAEQHPSYTPVSFSRNSASYITANTPLAIPYRINHFYLHPRMKPNCSELADHDAGTGEAVIPKPACRQRLFLRN
jgi:hypothetical protein